MKKYEIIQTKSGVNLGIYEGDTEEDAIEAMMVDAGCDEPIDVGLIAKEIE